MAAAFIRAELLSRVQASLRTSICSRSRLISAASPVALGPAPRGEAVCALERTQCLIPLIAPPRALDPIVKHRGIPARPGIPSQLLDSEAHLACPVGILPGAPRQILLIHF